MKLDVHFYSPEASLRKLSDLLKLRFSQNDQKFRNRLIFAVLEGLELWYYRYNGENIDLSEIRGKILEIYQKIGQEKIALRCQDILRRLFNY